MTTTVDTREPVDTNRQDRAQKIYFKINHKQEIVETRRKRLMVLKGVVRGLAKYYYIL